MRALATAVATALLMSTATLAAPARPSIGKGAIDAAVAGITAKHGAAEEARARQGAAQVAARWFPEDGDEKAYTAFCVDNFLSGDQALSGAFDRLETVLEQVDGHLLEVRRMLLTPQDLDTGPVTELDRRLGDVDLSAHVDDDLFKTKVAFLALLNFPVHTLADRLKDGASWSRDTWARSRMMDRWALRVPAEVSQDVTQAFTAADQYIAGYYIRADKLLGPDGKPLGFPDGRRLITHWNLRDELKANYQEKDGIAKQRVIVKVMERQRLNGVIKCAIAKW